MRLKVPFGLLVGVALVSAAGLREPTVLEGIQQNSCLVATADGDIQGVDMGSSCAFLGVPFTLPPTENNRWKPPVPLPPWSPDVLNADTPPPPCTANENCLKMNIWVSKSLPSAAAPILVWLHTGAFAAASANFPGTNGRKLAEETGVIVVEPNYRLGPLGFLAHAALAAESPQQTSGNYGLQDQRAALAWVRDHIAGFGGDPYNVTIAGTSAGGDSVGFHLISPASRGLFHRAIVQSGAPTIRWPDHSEAMMQGDALAAALSCTDPSQVLDCMRSKTLPQVFAALPLGSLQVLEQAGRVFWSPVVDGSEIPDQPRIMFEKGDFNRVPTLIGTNRDEAWGNFLTRSFPSGVTPAQYEAWLYSEFGPIDAPKLLAVYPAGDFPSAAEALARVASDVQYVCEARRLARLIERTEKSIYLYSYEYEIDALSLDHVVHGLESNVLFGNHYVPPLTPAYTLNAADLAMHQLMSEYWTRFAAFGNPNIGVNAAPSWPPFRHPDGIGRGSDTYLVLSSMTQEGVRLHEKQCDFLEPFFFRSVLGPVPASAP